MENRWPHAVIGSWTTDNKHVPDKEIGGTGSLARAEGKLPRCIHNRSSVPSAVMSAPTRRTTGDVDLHDPRVVASIDRYWRKNVTIMICLLVVWAAVGLGCGVLLADTLNGFHIGGFPLGFWFAQQGSIVVFVLLILIYSIFLNRLDAAHHAEMETIRTAAKQAPQAGGA